MRMVTRAQVAKGVVNVEVSEEQPLLELQLIAMVLVALVVKDSMPRTHYVDTQRPYLVFTCRHLPIVS